jgi:hypothetical protein
MYYYPPYYNNGAMPDMLTQMRQNAQPVQQQPSNGIVWVQGENAAKSYPVAPNTTVMLLDSESSTFYLKTSDASGMPLPLRVFDYKERTQNGSNLPTNAPQGGLAVDLSNYVTYDQLNEILDNMAQTQKKEKKSKGENENA